MIELTVDQQVKLLRLARRTIEEFLSKGTLPVPDMHGEFGDPVFQERCGAFVTLHIQKRLRGCIGYIRGVKNIPETIIDMARSAAFRDPRFPPLSRKEYESIDIEISVLSPIEEARDISEIVVGRDGLIISDGFNQGLLLPQVATEYGWSVEQFLENTCYKAGLAGDAWKRRGVKIEKFSAQVFGEIGLGLV